MYRQNDGLREIRPHYSIERKEIQLQKEINTLINEIQAAMKRQNERIRDLKKAIGENNNVIRSDSWIKRLRKRFQW